MKKTISFIKKYLLLIPIVIYISFLIINLFVDRPKEICVGEINNRKVIVSEYNFENIKKLSTKTPVKLIDYSLYKNGDKKEFKDYFFIKDIKNLHKEKIKSYKKSYKNLFLINILNLICLFYAINLSLYFILEKKIHIFNKKIGKIILSSGYIISFISTILLSYLSGENILPIFLTSFNIFYILLINLMCLFHLLIYTKLTNKK